MFSSLKEYAQVKNSPPHLHKKVKKIKKIIVMIVDH